MRKYLQRILIVTILVYLILVAALIYWQILESPELLTRPDNPRPRGEQLEPRPVEILSPKQ